MKKTVSKKKLTSRERVVLAEVTKGRSVKDAGRKAWPNQKPESARVSASQALRKATELGEVEKAYAKVGLTLSHLAKRAKELVDAETMVLTPIGPIMDPKTKKPMMKPVWQARAKGLEIVHKVRGDYKEKLEIPGLAEAVTKLSDTELEQRIAELLSKREKKK